MKCAAAFALAAAIMFSFSACKIGGSKGANKTINYSISAEPATLDPQIATDESSITVVQALFEGLTRLDANLTPQPGVASSWEHNSDSTQFTFHLRPDAKWSSKKYGPVTADDFVYAFQRALDPKTGSATCTQMYCIKNAKAIHDGKLPVSSLGVKANDAKTLVVVLESSCPDFPKLTAQCVYMPCNKKFFQKTAGHYGLETNNLLGNGPFRIDGAYGWEHGKYINLARSSTYIGKAAPKPSAVDFSIGTVNQSNSVSALKDQTVDAAPINSSQADSAKSIGCTLSSVQDTTLVLCFNTKSSAFSSQNVRCAFAKAINRSAVMSHLPGDSAAANSILLPDTMVDGRNYSDISGGPFYLKENAKEACRLYSSAGGNVSATVLCQDDSSVKLMLNEMITSWNSRFSNYFNMKPLSLNSLQSQVKSGSYDAAIIPIKPSDNRPDNLLSIFTGNSSNNPSQFKDAYYDSLLSNAQSKSGKDAAASYAAAEKYLNDQAVIYPLCYEKSFYAVAKGVSGIIFRPYGGGPDFINAIKG